jgi:O-antigen/teichoic acid export membrane protein
MPVTRVIPQPHVRAASSMLRRWAGRGRRPAWLLLSQLTGRALAFPLTLGVARLGGPSLLGQTSLALAFYATGCVITTVGLAQLATLEGGKTRAVSIWSIRRAAYVQLACSGPLLAVLGVKLGMDVVVVALMLLAVAIDIDSRCLTGFARGHFRPRYELVATALNGGVPLLGLLLFQLGGGLSLKGVAACFLGGSIAMRVYVAVDVPTEWPDLSQHREPFLATLRAGAVLSTLSIIVAIHYRLDQFVLGIHWDPQAFGVYSAGARVLDVAYALPCSICAFWAIHLQRRTGLGLGRLVGVVLTCASGGAMLFLLLAMLVPLFGEEFIVLIAYWPMFGCYAALMGLTVAIMTTAVAKGQANIPIAAMFLSSLARLLLLLYLAPKQSFVWVVLVLCATECATIVIMIVNLYRRSSLVNRTAHQQRRATT